MALTAGAARSARRCASSTCPPGIRRSPAGATGTPTPSSATPTRWSGCAATFAVDNVDTLWDHLFEIDRRPTVSPSGCAVYFELVRGRVAARPGRRTTASREAYMARWVRAAVADAGGRPVVVVCRRLPPAGAAAGIVEPTTAHRTGRGRRLPEAARRRRGRRTATWCRTRSGGSTPSTATSPACRRRSTTSGCGRRAGRRPPPAPGGGGGRAAARAPAAGVHRRPDRRAGHGGRAGAGTRSPAPGPRRPARRAGRRRWSTRRSTSRCRGPAGAAWPWAPIPAVVEMVAALSGDRVGRLHPDTPLPPLVHDAEADLERHGLDRPGDVTAGPDRRDRAGAQPRPAPAARARDPRLHPRHRARRRRRPRPRPSGGALAPTTDRLSALIEAGGYGPTWPSAAAAVWPSGSATAGGDTDALAAVPCSTRCCAACGELSDQVLARTPRPIGRGGGELGPLGRVLARRRSALWRHDRLLGDRPQRHARRGRRGRRTPAAVAGRGGARRAGAGRAAPRIAAVVAVRDAVAARRAAPRAGLPARRLAVMARVAADADVPPDLRGAAFGFGWSLRAAVGRRSGRSGARRRRPTVGDWLAGLFALAREEVPRPPRRAGPARRPGRRHGRPATFLVALPALRQAFAYFPPRERETIARQVLARRGGAGSARALLRLPGRDPTGRRAAAAPRRAGRWGPHAGKDWLIRVTDPDLERWRLVLGDGRAAPASAADPSGRRPPARDAALDWLYGRDEDLDRRDVRRGGGRHGGDGGLDADHGGLAGRHHPAVPEGDGRAAATRRRRAVRDPRRGHRPRRAGSGSSRTPTCSRRCSAPST